MSGYARAAHAARRDRQRVRPGSRASTSERLREEGVLEASIGHDAANVPDGEDVEIVYSSAVPAENPERLAARERGLADRPRAELLAELSALRRTIAVAGAHGKTTTASMIVHLLREGRSRPRLACRQLGRAGPCQLTLERGRVAGRGGRRVRPLDAQPRRRDRAAHERRARPSRHIRLAGGVARGLPRISCSGAAGRRHLGQADLLALLSPAAASGAIHVNSSNVEQSRTRLPPMRASGAPETSRSSLTTWRRRNWSPAARVFAGAGRMCAHGSRCSQRAQRGRRARGRTAGWGSPTVPARRSRASAAPRGAFSVSEQPRAERS